jgi:class 3 adenylate cyclase
MSTEPQIRFCTSADGTRIAYSAMGEGPPLVNLPAFGSSIEINSTHPDYREWYERLGRDRLLVEIDRRGVAASRGDVTDFSLDAHVADLAAVVDDLGLSQFDLCGSGDASAATIAYAAQNPKRVSHLVLFGVASDQEARDSIGSRALVALVRDNWGLGRRALADVTFPSGPIELQRWWSNLARDSMSADVAAEYLEFQMSVDVAPYLPDVEAPTLLIHRRRNRVYPVSGVRAVASMIRASTFVPIEGDMAHVTFGDISYVETVRAFIDDAPADLGSGEVIDTAAVRTILFTDIVGHTAMMSRLGDERGRGVLREHERITREVLATHGGTEVKTMGDGFMASFGSVTKAVDCAIALQRAFAEREGEPLSIRVGINAGEPIEEDGDLFGATVILASRIAAKAEGGEILVADTVRGLCSGKGFLFADRGEFVAKGFEDEVRISEVSWREG